MRHARPRQDLDVPAGFAEAQVEGAWRFASKHNQALEGGLAEWLRA